MDSSNAALSPKEGKVCFQHSLGIPDVLHLSQPFLTEYGSMKGTTKKEKQFRTVFVKLSSYDYTATFSGKRGPKYR